MAATRRRLLEFAMTCIVCTVFASAQAQPATPEARAEIEALVSALAGSACEFERNGRWYDAGRARKHLQRKGEWLRRRDLAPTAELFIERAASASSVSGKAYRVRCPPGRQPVPAAQWFGERLREIRNGS